MGKQMVKTKILLNWMAEKPLQDYTFFFKEYINWSAVKCSIKTVQLVIHEGM